MITKKNPQYLGGVAPPLSRYRRKQCLRIYNFPTLGVSKVDMKQTITPHLLLPTRKEVRFKEVEEEISSARKVPPLISNQIEGRGRTVAGDGHRSRTANIEERRVIKEKREISIIYEDPPNSNPQPEAEAEAEAGAETEAEKLGSININRNGYGYGYGNKLKVRSMRSKTKGPPLRLLEENKYDRYDETQRGIGENSLCASFMLSSFDQGGYHNDTSHSQHIKHPIINYAQLIDGPIWSQADLSKISIKTELATLNGFGRKPIDKYIPPTLSVAWPFRNPTSGKTLVLDMDETILSTRFVRKKGQFIAVVLRPFLYVFLEAIYPHYEIILFTSGQEKYVSEVLRIYPRLAIYFDAVLTRKYCFTFKQNQNVFSRLINSGNFSNSRRNSQMKSDELKIKRLSILKNRKLSNIVILDDKLSNWPFDLQNAVPITPFFNQNDNDDTLLKIKNLLFSIADQSTVVAPINAFYKE